MRTLASLLLALGILWVWRETAERTCLALLPASILIGVLGLSLRAHSLHRRRCLSHCWFQQGTLPARFLRGRFLVSLRALLVAFLTGGILLINLLLWSDRLLAALFGDALLVLLLFLWMRRLSRGLFQPGSRWLLIRSWTVGLNTFLMLFVFFAIQLSAPLPEYLRDSLEQTLHLAGRQVASNCPLIDLLVRLYQEKDALVWWLQVQGVRFLEMPALRWAAWSFFLLSGTLSLWAYGRFLVQMLFFAQSGGVDGHSAGEEIRQASPEPPHR